MSSERLRANTPKRWSDPRPEITYLKYFVVLCLAFFALLATALLAWYVIKPIEAQIFLEKIVHAIS